MNATSKGKTSKTYYKKVLLRILSAMLLVVVFLTFFLYKILNNAAIKNIKNSEHSIVQKTCTHTYDYLDQLAYISTYFSTFQKSVPFDSPNPEVSLWMKKSIGDNLSAYTYSHNHISNIYLKINSAEYNVDNLEPVSDTIIDTFIHNNISFAEDSAWPHNLYFSNVKNGNSVNNDVIIEVSSPIFSRKILNDGSGRLEFLIDKNGVIISAIDTKKIQKNILDIYGLTKANLSEDFFNLKIDDTTYFATIQTVKNSSLKIISIVPKAFYSEILNIALFESLIIGFVLASVLLISCYFIVSNVYKPIKNIANTFQYHFPENMEEFENEIEYINAKINQTISSKENYEQEFPKAIEKIHKVQMAALQSQINPHFLYNTLENIKVISVNLLDIENPVEECLVLLNNIMRESMDQKNIIIPLSREIQLADSYIKLMKMRYNNNFDVTWHIDSTLSDRRILKFILQPLLENSITHGFSNIGSNQIITISVSKHNDYMTISIEDNGIGIPEEKLKHIQNKLEKTDMETTENHIGLVNVNMRIRILYGEMYGISLESSEKGTKCVLKLPLE